MTGNHKQQTARAGGVGAFVLAIVVGLFWVMPGPRPSSAGAAAAAGSSDEITLGPITNPHFMGRPRAKDLRHQIQTDPKIRRFAFQWAINPDGLHRNTWFGVPAVQNPLDVWVTQEILYEVKPDFIVEPGTLEGGSAVLWAMLMEFINPDARIITIDIIDKVPTAKEIPVAKERVDFLIGDSVSPEILAEVKRRTAGGKVLVILDSLHTEEHVYKELQAYSPLVSLGSYLIVQDTGIGVPGGSMHPGAGRAATRFIAETDAFKLDRTRERLVMSHNPGGYLKRVR